MGKFKLVMNFGYKFLLSIGNIFKRCRSNILSSGASKTLELTSVGKKALLKRRLWMGENNVSQSGDEEASNQHPLQEVHSQSRASEKLF